MNDPNTTNSGPATPQVSSKTPPIPGVIPQNIRTWLTLLVTGLMLVTIYCSSGTPKPKINQPAAQLPFTSNGQEIGQYKAQLDAETRKLTAERQRLVQAKDDAEVAEKAAILGQVPQPYGSGGSAVPAERTPIETERQLQALERAKREERSLFASNIVQSNRKEAAAPAAQELPKTLPEPATRAADWTRLGTEDSQQQETNAKMYQLFEGTILETVLTNRLDGTFAGPVNVMVTTNVYSHDHQQLLIPQGTRVLGEVEKVAGVGQQRLAVFFHRLIMADGFVHSLDKYRGLSQVGETGLRDQVNHHYVQIFGASLAIGAIAGVAQAGASYGANSGGVDAYQRGSSQSLSQSALHILDRFLNVLPTFTVREGHRIKIILTDDLLLPAYAAHMLPANL